MTDTIIDKLLLQAVESNKIKIAAYDEQMAQLRTQTIILEKENSEYKAKYQELCPHTSVERFEAHHMPGGYDHVSETQYEDRCTRCNKVIRSKLVRGTYA